MAHRFGMYLREGTSVTPGVMTVDAGTLSFVTERGPLFAAPVTSVRGEFTMHSTLVLTTPTGQWTFVTGAYAGAYAPEFPESLVAQLAAEDPDGLARDYGWAAGQSAVGHAAMSSGHPGVDAGVAGLRALAVAKMFKTQAQSWEASKQWTQFLESQGVAMTWSGKTHGQATGVMLAWVLGGLAVFTVVTYAVVRMVMGQ